MTLFYQRFFSLVILVLFPNVKHWWLVMVSWHFIIRASSSVTMLQFWLVIAWERKGFDSSKNNCVCFIISLKKIQVTKGQIMCKLGKVFWETESVFPIHFQFFIQYKKTFGLPRHLWPDHICRAIRLSDQMCFCTK